MVLLQRLLTHVRVAGVVTVGFGTSCTALAASSGETPNFPGNGMRTMVYEGTSYPEWSRPAAVLPELQQSLQLRANDVVVASYPKSGTTWTLEIACMLVHGLQAGQRDSIWAFAQASKIDKDKDVGEYVAEVNAMEGPRVFKSHAPIEQFEFSHANTHPDAKIIYVTRNAKDTAASFYRQLSAPGRGFTGQFEDFFPLFFKGATPFGDWFKHTIDWWSSSQTNKQILFISYEEMKRDPEKSISEIAAFLGIRIEEDTLKAIVDKSSFTSMKGRYAAKENPDAFFHTGVVGGHAKYWTVEQHLEFDRKWDSIPNPKPTYVIE